jgi:hypothetical protein
VQIAGVGSFTPSCGTPTLTTSGTPPTTIQFTQGSVAAGQTCVVTIPVATGNVNVGATVIYPNPSVTLTSTQAAPVTAGPAIWSVSRP